jgi:putative tryptophan/tyrosine transport system substrate-binding protein
MRRRGFITLIGGMAAAWPLVLRAQQRAMPVIGYLSAGVPEKEAHLVAAFRTGLSEVGYVEGRNLVIEFRWALLQFDLLPNLAADLVQRHVAAIATVLHARAARAAKAATATIPIIFSNGIDPVSYGLVASFNHPGGNVTGITGMTSYIFAKRLGILHDLLPNATHFGVLGESADVIEIESELRVAATAMGGQIEFITVKNGSDIDMAFASLVQKRVEALIVTNSSLFVEHHTHLVSLAEFHRLPTIFSFREYVQGGGLMSYGPSLTDNARQVGVYTGRILKGEKPADLPVLRTTKLDLVINLSTAKALGLTVPPFLLATADGVIE